MVPAFTGLGAPHWNPEARGSLFGLTRSTGVAEIVRATLEAVGFQTADLLVAMTGDADIPCDSLKVDGGMTQNLWLLQFLADIMRIKVVRPEVSETTAYGIAMLAGVGSGIFDGVNILSTLYRYNRRLRPQENKNEVDSQKEGWKKAVESTCYFSKK